MLGVVLAGCRGAEPPEVTAARSRHVFLLRQIAALEELQGRAKRGELVTTRQIAIGVEEKVARDLLNAPLPRDIEVARRLRVRLEAAEPFFRGGQAALLFRARVASVDAPAAFARVELGGGLEDFRLEGGRLSARVKIFHFVLLDSTAGSLGRGVVENLFRDNLGVIETSIPKVEIPVFIEQSIRIEKARMGPVTLRPGELPLRIQVAEVIPANQRLWILLDAEAGPWNAGAAEAAP
jgi:hypothetical protein